MTTPRGREETRRKIYDPHQVINSRVMYVKKGPPSPRKIPIGLSPGRAKKRRKTHTKVRAEKGHAVRGAEPYAHCLKMMRVNGVAQWRTKTKFCPSRLLGLLWAFNGAFLSLLGAHPFECVSNRAIFHSPFDLTLHEIFLSTRCMKRPRKWRETSEVERERQLIMAVACGSKAYISLH